MVGTIGMIVFAFQFGRFSATEQLPAYNFDIEEVYNFINMASVSLNTLKQMMRILAECSGFDRVMSKVDVLAVTPGKVVCELRVEEEHTNRLGTMHGGLTATLVDVISTLAIMNSERGAPGIHERSKDRRRCSHYR
ncbi:acyl-coenzyme A thioesterase 13 isoform X3 [Nerophis ophidion]|uniref:acyl-coenzyme A thioesterase 13 isoform X3 n=1 Tax=Nerophis ophidion TaxID=159077 RepID=UPI002AE023E7|nr:acyl-coenzyme A thioesterase 13 isoform X3 [Nerophis ophidion]